MRPPKRVVCMLLIPSIVGDHGCVAKSCFGANIDRVEAEWKQSGSRVEAEWKQEKNALQHDLTPSISPRHVGNACKHDIFVHTKLT